MLPQLWTDYRSWKSDPEAVLAAWSKDKICTGPLIVRSSASTEDTAEDSAAGRYLSIPGVEGAAQLRKAVDQVFASYGPTLSDRDTVFVQPCLMDLEISGVAFTRDPNTGAPYFVVNYDESGDGAAVTSGRSKTARTVYCWKHHATRPPQPLGAVLDLLLELETLFGDAALDVEFGISRTKGLCLLQVRRLVVNQPAVDPKRHSAILGDIARRIRDGSRPHPYLSGDRTVYGIMPDWNPAEIIGVRPRPLALSLYRNLVTDQVWAYQRSNYGYKNLRSFPLMVSLHGLPYIDVRVSFNSFVPADIESSLADRLANVYIQRLLDAPALHDKVEFEIVYSCYTLDLPARLETLKKYAFSNGDIATLQYSLRRLTNNVIHAERGLWKQDAEKIETLDARRRAMLAADLDPAARIYWLLEDCKRWGTLPFAGLARAGFIAMQMLRSMVATGIIDEHQFGQFMNSTETVTSRMVRDMAHLPRDAFLETYGHLRPGTYDILSPRYDEEPDRYFGKDGVGKDRAAATQTTPAEEFRLSPDQTKALSEALRVNGLETDVDSLLGFIRHAIQGREHAKFIFTRSLSDALSLFKRFGADMGFSVDDLSYADIRALEDLVVSSGQPAEVLRRSIAQGRAHHEDTCKIILPPLITNEDQVWQFELPANEPNYVTQKVAEGHVCTADSPGASLKDGILFIQSADPGYDWIFAHGIKGFVTAYGGVNSHMAIRAGESGVPAIIGAGEHLFNVWRKARRLRIDCGNRRVEVLQG